MKLTIENLKKEAVNFCKLESTKNHSNLCGVSDGKTIGTYIEHEFQDYLKQRYEFTLGSSSKGIDFPDEDINTDIKVTSIKRPQSSSPFRNAEQKVYGLGYNLLIFVYDKIDSENECYLDFKHCTFVEAKRTGDYMVTKRLREMIEDGAIKEDIFAFLCDRNFPGDEISLDILSEKILLKTPEQGYISISNALQWRLQYMRVINLENKVEGVYNYDKC